MGKCIRNLQERLFRVVARSGRGLDWKGTPMMENDVLDQGRCVGRTDGQRCGYRSIDKIADNRSCLTSRHQLPAQGSSAL